MGFREDAGSVISITGFFSLYLGNDLRRAPIPVVNRIVYHATIVLGSAIIWAGDRVSYKNPSGPQPSLMRYLGDAYYFSSCLADPVSFEEDPLSELIKKAETESVETTQWRWTQYREQRQKQFSGGVN